VHKRAEVVSHTVNTNSQYNLPPFGKKLIYARNRQALKIAQRFTDASVRKSIEVNLRLLDSLDDLIGDVELYLERTVKVDDADTYRLRSIPGVGKILALVLLYEIHDIKRFALSPLPGTAAPVETRIWPASLLVSTADDLALDANGGRNNLYLRKPELTFRQCVFP
jgi:hypothetical protein